MYQSKYSYPKHFLNKDWVEVPERFKRLSDLIKQEGHKNVLDVGCATGELINYLSNQYPDWSFVGVDNCTSYIQEAAQRVPSASFYLSSALGLPDEFDNHFDITLAMGILGIFDYEELPIIFENLMRCTKKGGKVIIFSHFNTNPIDVMVRHRRQYKQGEWEKGWNIHSRATITELLGNKKHRYHEFELPFALPPQPDNPVRSWAIKLEDGAYQLVNGLKLWINFSFLEIEV